MSKTNHRINKDREERDSEAPIHKKRRESKQKLADLQYLFLDDDALLGEDEFEDIDTYEPIRKRR